MAAPEGSATAARFCATSTSYQQDLLKRLEDGRDALNGGAWESEGGGLADER
jgi:hypothetical protein